MKRAVITGLGFITSIGNSRAEVLRSLQECRSGVELFEEFADENIPVKLAGTVKGFTFPTPRAEDWTYPAGYQLTRDQLRAMTPNSLYAFCAMQQAIAAAQLPPEQISNPRTGLLCASGGSMWMAYTNLNTMLTRGVSRLSPMSVVNSIPGSLYVNLGASFKVKGATMGCSSACSSSAHSLGMALDLIRMGRQDTVFVVGAEDCSKFNLLPFASVRALSTQTNPATTPCAFDIKRDGFVGTGGGCTLVVEELEHALRRGAPIIAEVLGWGQTADGYNIMIPEPSGDGLHRAMNLALEETQLRPDQIDYINAHATSTPAGDISECQAIRNTFAGGKIPYVSSTKSLTGHGLSLAGAMESAFCCLAMQEGFTPVSANITELDPLCADIPIITKPMDFAPKIVMNNSSGFGGANVSVILKKWENA